MRLLSFWYVDLNKSNNFKMIISKFRIKPKNICKSEIPDKQLVLARVVPRRVHGRQRRRWTGQKDEK